MKTLTEKYNAVLEGKLSKKQFVRDARLALPQHITQYNGYEDAVAILKNKGMVFEGLEKYKEEKKISVLLASHNMDEVKRLCNSVMMMKDGNIVDSGTPENLIKKYGQKNLEEVFLEIVRNDK